MAPVRGIACAGLAAVAAALALVLVGTAGSATSAFVNLKTGDSLDVLHTGIVCSVQKGASGRLGVACYEATATGFLPRSYATVIVQDGEVSIDQINAKGDNLKQVFDRKLAAAAKRVRASVGQAFHVTGTPIDCAIVKTGTGAGVPTVYCSKDDKVGPVPGTYATLISDRVASVGKIGANRVTTAIVVKNQP